MIRLLLIIAALFCGSGTVFGDPVREYATPVFASGAQQAPDMPAADHSQGEYAARSAFPAQVNLVESVRESNEAGGDADFTDRNPRPFDSIKERPYTTAGDAHVTPERLYLLFRKLLIAFPRA